MSWIEVYGGSYSYREGITSIDHTFYTSTLIVKASSIGAKPSWNRAAIIYPIYLVSGVGEVRGKSQTIYLNAQTVEFTLLQSPYKINFSSYDWIQNLTLRFWESDMPLYGPPSSSNIPQGSNTITNKIVPVPATIANPVELLPANSARKGFEIVNNSTGNVRWGLGEAPTAASKAIIYPDFTYEDPFNWKGTVFGLWEIAGGNGVHIREFT